MRSLLRIFAIGFLLYGCGNVKDVVFGPDPLSEIEDKNGKLKDLKDYERVLIKDYVVAQKNGDSNGIKMIPLKGRTVNDVLFDSAIWKEVSRTNDALERLKQKEFEVQMLQMELNSSNIRRKTIDSELQEYKAREIKTKELEEASKLENENKIANEKAAKEKVAQEKLAQAKIAQANVKKKPVSNSKKSIPATKKPTPKKK